MVFQPAAWLPLLFFCLKMAASPIVVPFQLAGNSIVVEALVNGVAGKFILDTGSPEVLLNNAWFEGFEAPSTGSSNVMDIHGKVSEWLCYNVKELKLGGAELPRQLALVLDLRNLETMKGMYLLGILGYSAFRNFELMFDFENLQLTLFPLKKNGDYAGGEPSVFPSASFDLEMCGHIPAVIVHWKGKALRMGIDSGSEINVFDASAFEKEGLSLFTTDSVMVRGISRHRVVAPVGFAQGFSLGDWEPGRVQVTVADLKHIQEQVSPGLDGLLGTPFLQKGKMAINYKRKKLYLWREERVQLAAEKELARGR